MKVSDIVRFSKERCFNGAVQTEWFYDNTRVGHVAGSYVFHGPKYFGVSEADVDLSGHRLVDTASFALNMSEKLCAETPNNTFMLTIAGYGAGKSHLAVSLAALFSNTDRLSAGVIRNISIADNEIGQKIARNHTKKDLVVVLNGMNNFNLDAEVLKCVRLSLKMNSVSESVLKTLTKSYDIARYFVERNYSAVQERFEAEASAQGISLRGEYLKKHLIENLESDARTISCINSVYKYMNGDSIQWDRGLAAGDILTTVCNSLCGPDKPFNKVLILFDEFGRYIEYAAAYPEIAGEAALQQVFEAVQSSNGKMIFAGFVQSELDAYLARIEKSSNIIRYVGRYKSSENLFLSSNFETILANVLQKVDESRHNRLVGNAVEYYKTYHSKLENALVRWDRTQNKKSVWTDPTIYDSVILHGCYPLHPYTVWLLSNMNRWMQQRSAIAFAAEMVDRISEYEIDGARLPYVYPINIIDSSIYDEMLNSEEKGLVQSQYCMLYRDILLKVGDKLKNNELTVLKAVLITNIARFAFRDKEDALVGLKYCSNLSEDEITLALRDLENLHGVVSFDENTNTFDLIAEANGLNEFKRVYSRYRIMTNSAVIGDMDESLRKELSLTTEIETSFGQVHNIVSLEWKFKKSLYNSTEINRDLLASKLCSIESASNGEDCRGELIFAYCPANASSEISRLSALHKELNLGSSALIIIFLDDTEGEIITALTLKNVLNRFSNSDRERFEKYITAQHRAQNKKIIRNFNLLVQNRSMIANTGLMQYQGRLNALCTGRFESVFTCPVPFAFDGFENKTPTIARRYLTNICIKMFDKTLMNVQSYHALTSDEKNRVKAVLSVGPATSWQVYNNSCSLAKPQNAVLLTILNDIDQAIEDSDELQSVMKLFAKYTKKPYGMNLNALALFIFYYIAYKDKHMLCYYGSEKLLASHVSDKILKKQRVDPKELFKVKLQRNIYENRDLVQELCREIMSCNDAEQCTKYRGKLEQLTAQEGISDENQLAVAAAMARLDEGISLNNDVYDKINKANEILSEAKESFNIRKFYKIFSYYVDTSSLISKDLPFVYSEQQKMHISSIKSTADQLLNANGLDGIRKISCKITQLSQLKTICNNMSKTLQEHGYANLAEAINRRYVVVEEELIAKQKYETTLAELDKDAAMLSRVQNMGYADCSSWLEKMHGWTEFFTSVSDLPQSIVKDKTEKVAALRGNLQTRMSALSDEYTSAINQVETSGSLDELTSAREMLQKLVETGINDSDTIAAIAILRDIELAAEAIANLPNSITKLKDFVQMIPDGMYGSCRRVVYAEAQKKINSLSAQQRKWIERIVVPAENDVSNMSEYDCTNWLNRTSEIPEYLDDEAVVRYRKIAMQVESRLHKNRVESVVAMYQKLTEKEKLEVQKAILRS